MAQRTQVELFLAQFRESWPPRCLISGERDKNLQGLADLNLTAKQREAEIMGLSVENYHDGPLENKSRGGQGIWIFGKVTNGTEVYIKLNIFEAGGQLHATCISFHPAERCMKYPFAQRGMGHD